jgi:hypothetical protein
VGCTTVATGRPFDAAVTLGLLWVPRDPSSTWTGGIGWFPTSRDLAALVDMDHAASGTPRACYGSGSRPACPPQQPQPSPYWPGAAPNSKRRANCSARRSACLARQ